MKKYALAAACFLAACGGSAGLQEGRWTGDLTPMNHPDRTSPIAYDVDYSTGKLSIALVGPDGGAIPARDARLDADTLRFSFNEPEEGVPLRCALGGDGAGGFSGRCTDADGKWARFTMRPPSPSSAP